MVFLQKWPFFQFFLGKIAQEKKKRPFFQLSFKGNIGQENVFYDILERKNASLGYKNKKFKKSKD